MAGVCAALLIDVVVLFTDGADSFAEAPREALIVNVVVFGLAWAVVRLGAAALRWVREGFNADRGEKGGGT